MTSPFNDEQQEYKLGTESTGEGVADKKRRREKNVSSDILNVIDWKLQEGDGYDGLSSIPRTIDENNNNNDKNNAADNFARSTDDEFDRQKTSSPIQNGQTNGHANGHVNKVSDAELDESLSFLEKSPDAAKVSNSEFLTSLMDTYLNQDYLPGGRNNRKTDLPPPTVPYSTRSYTSHVEKMEDLERNLSNIRVKNKKQPPPPVRTKPEPVLRQWEDPRDQQRTKAKEKSWPPREVPKDTGAYVVESFGQTDPYSKRLIKDIQRNKREEEEKLEAEKRAEIVNEHTKPVLHLRSVHTHKPKKTRPGVVKPVPMLAEERSWIKHEKKAVEFDAPPDEPDWMKLIRNRRWKSTVKARFPCKASDRTEFDRRSTTPKNWRRLAKDKQALAMLSEIVGIGAEGEELFLRLANQREQIEKKEDQEERDRLAQQELMAYEVARESLGSDAAYSLEMDNPLPAARMRRINSASTVVDGGSVNGDMEEINISNYPFTTSQMEAAYLTNQLLRLHPEEFKKLLSLERSRQATLRWQFSSDPFDSVHEHQSLPFEMALLASEEPRLKRVMRKILGHTRDDDYQSVFSSAPPSRMSRAHSESGYYPPDGYESCSSRCSSTTGADLQRGRSFRKKKAPIPTPKRTRTHSTGPTIGRGENTSEQHLTVPHMDPMAARKQLDDDREVHAHGLLTDKELKLSEEIAKLREMTSTIGKDIEKELQSFEDSLSDSTPLKKGFFQDLIDSKQAPQPQKKTATEIDADAIASRRREFVEHDLKTANASEADDRRSLPKTRHKVRRINSSAQLDAVFRKRRELSESDVEDNAVDDVKSTDVPDVKDSEEIKILASQITDTFSSG